MAARAVRHAASSMKPVKLPTEALRVRGEGVQVRQAAVAVGDEPVRIDGRLPARSRRSTRGDRSDRAPASPAPASAVSQASIGQRRHDRVERLVLGVEVFEQLGERVSARRPVCPHEPEGEQSASMGEHLHLLAGEPVTSLQHWVDRGGGRGLDAAREMGPEAVVAEVEASGTAGPGRRRVPHGHQVANGARAPRT